MLLPAHCSLPQPSHLSERTTTLGLLAAVPSRLRAAFRVQRQPQWTLARLLSAALLAVAVAATWWLLAPPRVSLAPDKPLQPTTTPLLSTGRDHLLIYAFSNSDPQFLENLQYFVREAVVNDTRADHIIIVQEGPGLQVAKLPDLPAHAAYVRHQNECYDWGSYGWLLLRTGLVALQQYRYFFFVNSSVRGPFLPAYARGWYHWMTAFTARLSEDVKLVGSTISCEGSPLHGKRSGMWRRNPHVQSYAVATDQVGLQVLLQERHVFACHRDRWDTIYYSELGSSLAILSAGYNIDSLMLRYQGVDWRNRSTWGCNERMSPAFEFSCDGTSLDPLEVMFVKVKSYMLENDFSASKKAARYQTWQQQTSAWAAAGPAGAAAAAAQSFDALAANEYVDQLPKFKVAPILLARARNANCFDFTYYAKENSDLKGLWGDVKGLWRHWIYYGQFDYRPHKWLCDIDYKNVTGWPGPRPDTSQ